jgi:p24 family protein delta-1
MTANFQIWETEPRGTVSREIELDVEIGADARDWSSIQAQEKLKPVETDLRRIEEVVEEIVSEMEYLRKREQKLRDTNESTNERVKWFAFGTMGMLVGLGAWQIVYLRAYFRFVLPSLPTLGSPVLLTYHADRSILFS